ncbi:unnamed protein product [Bursaphelenchus okinawaensis]|uniref:Protein kinase domain-containing protein n=1 Tax=Bursaphelenchus okinawaensis TaxID=465554 RepID=A0A811L167_9BILA|nr:unnamed protein product [Bursaphelenchus okinawaensis]CAG9114884.1 unnamed protein product [Bursaphelenchus okinawaensis]
MFKKKSKKTTKDKEKDLLETMKTSDGNSLEQNPINQKAVFDECGNESWFFGYVQGKSLMPYLKTAGDFGISFIDQLEIVVMGEKSKYIIAATIDNTEIKISSVNTTFPGVKKMVEELSKKKYKLIKGVEKLRLAKPMETPPWILHKASLSLARLSKGMLTFNGRLFEKIEVLIRTTSQGLAGASIEKTNRVLSNECQRLVNLKHLNLTLVYGLVCTELPVQLVCEFFPGRTLKEFLLLHGQSCSDTDRLRFALEIANALVYVHEQNIVHRQVVADKCYVSHYGHLKLSGFGLSATPDELNETKPEILTQQNIPIRAMAPECLIHKPKHSLSCDIWAFGIFLYEIYSNGESPWRDWEVKKIATAIRKIRMPSLPSSMSDDAKKFVESKCWVEEPKNRAKVGELKSFIEEQIKNAGTSDGTQDVLKAVNGVEPLIQSQVEQKHEEMLQQFTELRNAAVWPKKVGDEKTEKPENKSTKRKGKTITKKKKTGSVVRKNYSAGTTTTGTVTNQTVTSPKETSVEKEKPDKTEKVDQTEKGQTKSAMPALKKVTESKRKNKEKKSPANTPAPKKLPRPAHAHHEIDDDYSGSLKDEK